jgi:hypothetical protein
MKQMVSRGTYLGWSLTRLIRVADDCYPLAGLSKEIHQLELSRIGILELVDEDMFAFDDMGSLLQKLNTVAQEVIEI